VPVDCQYPRPEQHPVGRRNRDQVQAAAEPLGIKRIKRRGREIDLRLVIVQQCDHSRHAHKQLAITHLRRLRGQASGGSIPCRAADGP
jgi:hypothetical protein